ncbi:MAG: serine/threonine protein kinase [Myxococcales bacterium]|nr:serine/threonine protein kinase [Myxococcales bacterium]
MRSITSLSTTVAYPCPRTACRHAGSNTIPSTVAMTSMRRRGKTHHKAAAQRSHGSVGPSSDAPPLTCRAPLAKVARRHGAVRPETPVPESLPQPERACPICGEATALLRCPNDDVPTITLTAFARDALSFKLGDVVSGRYKITGTLGRGGFGAVYAAEHVGTRQAVALKMLTLDVANAEDDVVRRFYREAQVTAALSSPHTVKVFDVGQADNGPLYLAMELLVGQSLEQELRALGKRGERMAESRVVDVGLAVCRSLAEAHKANLVHRDLKPANIMLAKLGDEDEPVVKVLDFGIARTEDSSMTAQGSVLGTPQYMSPEQCRARPLDGRSDLYALGVILFRCAAGRLPFEDRNPLALMYLHANEPPPDLQALAGGGLSEGFVDVVRTALEKEPVDRFADARAMRQALEEVRSGAWAGTPHQPRGALVAPARAPSGTSRRASATHPAPEPSEPSGATDIDEPANRTQLSAAPVPGWSRAQFAAVAVVAVLGLAVAIWLAGRSAAPRQLDVAIPQGAATAPGAPPPAPVAATSKPPPAPVAATSKPPPAPVAATATPPALLEAAQPAPAPPALALQPPDPGPAPASLRAEVLPPPPASSAAPATAAKEGKLRPPKGRAAAPKRSAPKSEAFE